MFCTAWKPHIGRYLWIGGRIYNGVWQWDGRRRKDIVVEDWNLISQTTTVAIRVVLPCLISEEIKACSGMMGHAPPLKASCVKDTKLSCTSTICISILS